jgi:hypothetical protein
VHVSAGNKRRRSFCFTAMRIADCRCSRPRYRLLWPASPLPPAVRPPAIPCLPHPTPPTRQPGLLALLSIASSWVAFPAYHRTGTDGDPSLSRRRDCCPGSTLRQPCAPLDAYSLAATRRDPLLIARWSVNKHQHQLSLKRSEPGVAPIRRTSTACFRRRVRGAGGDGKGRPPTNRWRE